jgi:hypothetical protein
MRPEWRDPYHRDRVVAIGAIGMAIMFLWLLLMLPGCGSNRVKSACIVEAEKGMCWIAKKENKGKPLAEMEGEFCINMQDTARLLRRLNECENGDKFALVSMEFPSLCVIEAKAGMCWVKKKENRGRAFSQMEKNNCVDRVDLDRIMSKLNECTAGQKRQPHSVYLDHESSELHQLLVQLQESPR